MLDAVDVEAQRAAGCEPARDALEFDVVEIAAHPVARPRQTGALFIGACDDGGCVQRRQPPLEGEQDLAQNDFAADVRVARR